MYRIHFDNRSITVCPVSFDIISDPNAVAYYPANDRELSELPLIFDINTKMRNLYIPTDRPEEVFATICKSFTQVAAAGGVVRNNKNEFLMIFRKGLWDLPKGQQEADEDISLTAVREVEEECGIEKPELKALICITHHTFHRDGKFILKHTYWYDMRYNSTLLPKPQLEEEITKAVWVSEQQVRTNLENSFSSIKEVFRTIGIE